jgi:hypothetical protein
LKILETLEREFEKGLKGKKMPRAIGWPSLPNELMIF